MKRNFHWILLIVMTVSFFMGFQHFELSTPALVATLFGMMGLIAMIYLSFITEKQKRDQHNRK
ncbi:hypothetical protein [Bacillus pinisoli]|uniref:hypothetical protein n=1 Tax=Bacillus pinisoli TaxID=2901866 RepID=UPI001FF2474C|nr:hypothetical protein [Bacillus pinisoli]